MFVLGVAFVCSALWVVATLYGAIGAVLFVTAMIDLPPGTWKQKHHAYWGAILYAACTATIVALPHFPLWVFALLALGASIGAGVLYDDGREHIVQALTGNLRYETRLKRWFYRTFPSLARY